MLPQKLGSVRYPAVRRATFRDDNNLVTVRYEKTTQAEPPIPVHTRNPIRAGRPPSSSSSSYHSHHRPIVVPPPPGVVPPPTEEHPAFRTSSPAPSASSSPSPSPSPPPVPRRTSPLDEWKRDSGVARTNSSATIREECEEEAEKDEICALKLEEVADTIAAAVSPAVRRTQQHSHEHIEEHIEGRFLDTPESSARPSVSSTMDARPSVSFNTEALTGSLTPPVAFSFPLVPAPAWGSERPTPVPSPAPSDASSKTPSSSKHSRNSSSVSSSKSPRKLVKSMSSQTAARFRKKSFSEVVHSVAMPVESLLRGSKDSPARTRASSGSSGHANPSETTPKAKAGKGSSHFWSRSRSSSTKSAAAVVDPATVSPEFLPLDVTIPTDSLLEDDFLTTLSFSNRGSIMIGSNQPIPTLDGVMDHQPQYEQPLLPLTTATPEIGLGKATLSATSPSQDRSSVESNPKTTPMVSFEAPPQEQPQVPAKEATPMPPPDIRVLAADVEKESQKVRSLYKVGDGVLGEPGARRSYCERLEPTPEAPSEENEYDPAPGRHLSPDLVTPRSGSSFSPSDVRKTHFELAGGLEDWEDVDGADVDRYGFINLPRPLSRVGTPTEMKSAQYSPRKRNVLQKRDAAGLSPLSGRRTPTRKVSTRSLNTQTSELSISPSVRSSRSVIRQAGNLLPHNRDRRWMDEAGDMLNVSPGLQDIEEEVKTEKITEALKRREWERSEKWRKMAKIVRKGGEGQGMDFEFDTKNPKLIERTWKGIPDRWRGAAWWSFLATSARNHGECASDEQMIAQFHRLQVLSSPDDVQIDLDVPRTISRHIMFRRRYRGGQRLLFRVLHAISIYFPETGYVQGMASLAATLLCYFDEEKCFVMLVRMWKLRGLARLYQPGFEELMKELAEFNARWLNKEVAEKLAELCIDITAYGTRWYLTLFNLSLPFPAQLRVWDVFLLLGDDGPGTSELTSEPSKSETPDPTAIGTYDILHATSAALAQALREVLLDSDFENAMKALTSWIPIKDEDLLMKVTKAEWKSRHGKKKASNVVLPAIPPRR